MILEHDGTHASRVRESRDFDRVDRSRAIIGSRVNVNVDGAGKQARVRSSSAALSRPARSDDCHRERGDSHGKCRPASVFLSISHGRRF
jgi:hypothetical protein